MHDVNKQCSKQLKYVSVRNMSVFKFIENCGLKKGKKEEIKNCKCSGYLRSCFEYINSRTKLSCIKKKLYLLKVRVR